MKIIDILKHSAELLGMKEEVNLLSTAEQSNESEILKNEDIKKLFNLSQFSIQELCTNYVPVVTEAEITTKNKAFAVADLTNFIRIDSVTQNGKPISYKFVSRKICFDCDGTFKLKYLTYPEIKSLFDDIDFLATLSPDAIVCGLCAYFCLAKGLFDDFKIYHEKYVNRAESIKSLKSIRLPQRRWE